MFLTTLKAKIFKYAVFLAVAAAAVFLIQQAFDVLLSDVSDLAYVSLEARGFQKEEKVEHIKTPEPLKAIYMTSWVAGTPKWRTELVNFIKKSEINSLVTDVKDYTGRVAFDTKSKLVDTAGSEEIRIQDLKEFVNELHQNNIYAIARITVFQDPFYAKYNSDIAVKTKTGSNWKDRKGLMYIDPSAEEFWQYTVEVAREAEKMGFDELNFDYIRFPSDGNMKDIAFPISQKVLSGLDSGGLSIDSPLAKEILLEQFFKYLNSALKNTGVPISADVFGMTMTNFDGLNIGQVLERIEPYFDYVSPMVYPSHYPATFQGFKNPAAHPYEVVLYSMKRGVERVIAASSSPLKLRPWLQDFDLGAIYDAQKIRAQIQATYDAGLTSWMMWDPANKYTKDGYLE
ncbi:MAG: putative glycoside hydrolase [Patescibacteria group bacterium]